MTRRSRGGWWWGVLPGLILSASALAGGRGEVGALRVLGPDYPRVFFFRGSEGPPSVPRTRYEDWDAQFSRLMGIMGKCLDEEVLGRGERNPEFFGRFKEAHPEQAVMLHLNGNSRDPRYRAGKFFPGHWIHRRATRIVADVAAEEGETEIRVEDAGDFRVGTGRYRTSTDDIALFGIGAGGVHDWGHCEQVQLVSVDVGAGVIRVRRGCYGTRPLAFRAGASRAAAHAAEGPWGKKNNLLWFYNYSTLCPRDREGKTCADRFVDDLAEWFGPSGELGRFDGLEFDVLFNETSGDTDGDGVEDDGVVGGSNRYGAGVIEFARKLRERMGENFLILGDGALGPGGRRSQRAFGLLNGIESEGWPNLNDWEFEDWSGGLNRQAFWRDNGRAPAFSYINHKWVEPIAGKPGEHAEPEVAFARHRLAFAAAQFVDSAICYSFAPAREKNRWIGVWDELWCGAERRLGWLGKPEGPVERLARRAPDLLGGAGGKGGERLAGRLSGAVRARATAGGVEIRPADGSAEAFEFWVRDVEMPAGDLVVLATMRGEPMAGYPQEMARLVECEVSGGVRSLSGREPDGVGMALRGGGETAIAGGSGAMARYRQGVRIGDRGLSVIAVHPPYREGRGYVYWTRDIDVPAGYELRFSLGMSELAPKRSDGVWFRVEAAEIVGGVPGAFRRLFEESSRAHAWLARAVSLAEWAGRRVRLKFVADCGPADNATTDQGMWGDVRIARVGVADALLTAPVARMTWCGERPFESGFYFRGLRAGRVDLRFSVEGGAPVTLVALGARAAPDAMVRRFENGIVLANPSAGAHAFDLGTLAPGREYRRLRASAGQDAGVNNGAPVVGTVTLEGRDALFLVRAR